jgi:hypothetical protein
MKTKSYPLVPHSDFGNYFHTCKLVFTRMWLVQPLVVLKMISSNTWINILNISKRFSTCYNGLGT